MATVRSRGMTLIEVLVAMLILSIGATSLIALFASASATHKRAVDRTHAALVAEEIFSELQMRWVADVELKDLLADLRKSLPERIDDYYWEVTLHRPADSVGAGARLGAGDAATWDPDELVARVTIKWSRAAESHEEVYSTILLPRPAGAAR